MNILPNIKKLNLSYTERHCFRLHNYYSLIEGIITGVLILNEFVFVRSLKASEIQLSLLYQFSSVVLIFSVFLHELLKRIKNKNRLVLLTGIITRLPLLLLLFFPKNATELFNHPEYHYFFLAIFLVYYFSMPIIFPIINAFLKTNYSHENFGTLYSYSTSLNKIAMLVATFVFGLLLDADNFIFVYVFPLIGLLGICSAYLLSKIHYKENVEHLEIPFWKSIKQSFTNMFKILRENKPYKHFEIGFMFYGFAFLSTASVITLFFDRVLHLNYSSVAFYKNAYNIIAILLLPYFGRLIGKIDPRKFAAITFGSICLFLIILASTEYVPNYVNIWGIKLYYLLIPYILIHSIFAATMGLLWSIGSIYFCQKHEAADYQSVHITLTGERAIFAPILGVLFYNLFGFFWTFMIAVGSLMIAIGIMVWSYRTERK